MQAELFANVTALKSSNTQLAALATTDPLTALANHGAMAHTLNAEIERARRHNRSFALLFCDIDHFKAINDTYGHNSGDSVLQAFAMTTDRPYMGARSTEQAVAELQRCAGTQFDPQVVLAFIGALSDKHSLQQAA